MINKKLKLMIQLIMSTSVFSGYNIIFNDSIITNAYSDIHSTDKDENIDILNNDIIQQLSVNDNNVGTVFLKADGTAWGTGCNTFGALGLGTDGNKTSPVLIMSNVKRIYHFGLQTFFVKNDGTTWATGYNNNGQLGVGNTTNQYTPVQISIDNVVNITCNYSNYGASLFFTKSDGTIWVTGADELILGSKTVQPTPIKLPIDNVKEIIVNKTTANVSNYLYFIKNDGTVWATGNNGYGKLGIGTNIDQTSPVQVPITNVQKIIVNYIGGSSYFIKNDGTVWGCGYNGYYGQLGIGNNTNQTSPVQIPVTDVKDVITGSSSTFFVKTMEPFGVVETTPMDN